MIRSAPLRRQSLKSRRRARAWAAVVKRCKEKRGDRCQRCGSQPIGGWSFLFTISGHHKLPRSRGGKDTEQNCVLLCVPCHTWTHDHPREAVRLGLLAGSEKA